MSAITIGSIIFVLGYLLIAVEHKTKISKSAIALGMGSLLWILVAGSKAEHFSEDIHAAGGEIFQIVVFLLAAMSLVEILIHYRFFDVIRGRLYALGLDDRKQFLLISVITFFLSAVLDNLTTTIVMIQIARRFFSQKNLLVVAGGIVIAANAGGAWSPIGDVTTIMLWIAQKFEATEIMIQGFLPSVTIAAVSALMMYRLIEPNKSDDQTNEIVKKLTRSETVVVVMTFVSFALPVVMNTVFKLPPYLGLSLGLGVVWTIIELFKRLRPEHETHLGADVENLLKKTDIASIKFFIGILLAVSALHALGVLEILSHQLYGEQPSLGRLIAGNVGIGAVSAILDNVPLAAIAIQVLQTTDSALWVLLAVTLGTGGSMLVIGSAAGVVAMGMVKELDFGAYLKIATIPAVVGYIAGIGVWVLQYFFLGLR